MGDPKFVINDPCEEMQIKLYTGDAPEPFQYEGYNYTLESVQSVIDLVEWKGDQENTVIFVDESGIQVILDDTVTGRPKDTAQYSYKDSLEFQEWKKNDAIGNILKQRDLVDFLKRRPEGEVDELEYLLATIQKLNLATVITGEYEQSDSNNVTVSFKIKESEGSAKIPKTINVHMPLIFGSDKVLDMEVELEFRAPRNEGEKPVFLMTIPKYKRYRQEAIEYEVNKLKEALEGYLIMSGRGLK